MTALGQYRRIETISPISSVSGRHDVEAFLRDELLETLPSVYDRAALAAAREATYVIHQDISYTYSTPVRNLRQRLVILPRTVHLDQRRLAQRFDVRSAEPSTVRRRTDRSGNSVLSVTAERVTGRIDFVARSVIARSVIARSVIARSTADHPRPTWHRDSAAPTQTTGLTAPDAAIRDAVAALRLGHDVGEATDAIAHLVRQSFEYRHDVTSVRTTAAQAWALRQGVCQDMAHVMIAMCSSVGIAARYVSGHLVGDGASHAWVEVLDPSRMQVIAIDPTHDRRTDLRYITTATGRDYRDVAPTTGYYTSSGGCGRLSVRKSIRLADVR